MPVAELDPDEEVTPAPRSAPKVMPLDEGDEVVPLGGSGTAAPAPWNPRPATEPPKPHVPGATRAQYLDVVGDTAGGLGTGIEKGTTALVGLPADLVNAYHRGWSWLIAHGATAAGIATPEQAKKWRDTATDTLHVPGSPEINQAVESVAGPYYKPHTTPGQYAETVGEFIPASGARTPADIALRAVIPGVASEAAGQATKGTAAEPWARMTAGIIGYAPATVANWTAAPARMLRNATADLTEPQWNQVRSLMADANRMGTPLTMAEAVQHVTNGGTTLGDIQRVVEQSSEGAPRMKAFMAQRAPGNMAVADTMTRAAGVGAAGAPTEIAPRVQAAATQTVDQARQRINAQAEPHYQAAANDVVTPHEFNTLAADPAFSEALRRVRADPVKSAEIQAYPDHSIPVLDAVKKELDSWGERTGTALNPEADNYLNALLSRGAERTRDTAATASPAYRQALDIGSTGRQTVLDPLTRSPTGQLAAADTYPKQASIIFDPKPLPGSQYGVRDAVASVAARDPDAARDLVGSYLKQQFDEASQALVSGPNQWGGAKYAAILRGNPQQARNLEAAVRALPNGDEVWRGFNRMLDVFEAQGRRQPAGSQTAQNQVINQGLTVGGPGQVVAAVTSPGKWTTMVNDWYKNFRYGQNTDMLARILTSPDAVGELRRLGAMSANSDRARAVANNLIVSRMAYEGANRQPAQAPQ
jgi:hypothetical protein